MRFYLPRRLACAFLATLSVASVAFASSTARLDWETTSASTVSPYERSSRYAYPLKISQSEFQRARNVKLPASGKIIVTLSFEPHIDKDIDQSSVIDLFGAVFSFKEGASLSKERSSASAEIYAYAETRNQQGQWFKAMTRTQVGVPSTNAPRSIAPPSATPSPPSSIPLPLPGGISLPGGVAQPPASSQPGSPTNPRRRLTRRPKWTFEIVIDINNGQWHFAQSPSSRRFKLAPTAKEQSIRIYQGEGRSALPIYVTITDAN